MTLILDATGCGQPFLDILRTAIFALRGNWLRSALTSLGVIIGIAAVIVMVSVGQGTQAEIEKLVSGLGSQRLDIGPGAGRGFGGQRISASSFFTLSEDDADAVRREVPGIQYVSAMLRGNTQAVYAENNWSSSWQGVETDWFTINGWEIATGPGFDSRDYTSGAKSAILGESVRRELFGEEDKKEEMDVLNTGVLFRYNHDGQRKGHWKAKDFEAEIANCFADLQLT